MDLLDPEAPPEYALQCIKWCMENGETDALNEHLKLHGSKLSSYAEEYVTLMLNSISKNLASSLVTFLPYVDDVILSRELFNGGKTVINKMLCQAVMNGDLAIVESLLERGADSKTSFQGKPLLHEAACMGDVKMVDVLVKHGADVNAVDRRGDGILFAVIRSRLNDKASMVEHLIQKGADVSQKSASGKYPIHIPVAHSGGIMDVLVAAGQHVDVIDDVHKDTPLHIACGLCCRETIVKLIQNGAKFNLTNKHGETPLEKLLKYTTDSHDFHSRTRTNTARKLMTIGFKMSKHRHSGQKAIKGRDKIHDKYLSLLKSMKEPPSLQSLSRATIINSVQPKSSPIKVIQNLEIPQHLKNFILFLDGSLVL